MSFVVTFKLLKPELVLLSVTRATQGSNLAQGVDNSSTCGNEASFSENNGDRHIKTMGYILVQ